MEEHMNEWMYKGSEFNGVITGLIGFVYCIEGPTGKYIGKKNFHQHRTPKGKKNKVTSESNWKKYWSSCAPLKDDIKLIGKDKFSREILVLCESHRQMTYVETSLQFKLDVLKDDTYYNTNISGKFYHWFEV